MIISNDHSFDCQYFTNFQSKQQFIKKQLIFAELAIIKESTSVYSEAEDFDGFSYIDWRRNVRISNLSNLVVLFPPYVFFGARAKAS